MEPLKRLLLANMARVEERLKIRPDFFARQAETQTPEFLWIGCSDSRVPAEDITGCGPGELFVHRNIANLVLDTDLSVLSGLQYAIEVLKVNHVIVCGHYNCGGVKSAMSGSDLELVNSWLQPVKDIYCACQHEIGLLATDQDRWDRMVEINVGQQLQNLANTTIVRRAWQLGEPPILHGWVYDLRSGLLKEVEQVAANRQPAMTAELVLAGERSPSE
jgi:carbonic anhydrase